MSRLNVILLENEPSSRRGGQELSLIEIAEGLKSQGHEITLFYTTEGDLLSRYRNICKRIIKVEAYSIDRKKFFISAVNFIRDVFKVRKERHSVVYSNQYHDTLFGAAISFMRDIPFVCHLRLSPPGSFCGQWRIGLRGVDRFVAVSNKTKAEWISNGLNGKKIGVVYNGVNTKIFMPSENRIALKAAFGLTEEDRVILFVGRIDKDKGLEMLLKAIGLLQKKWTRLKLFLAGKPHNHATLEIGKKYLESLIQLSKDLDIENTVQFLGHISNPIQLYQASDVLILPSVASEAFGRVLIEAMACGVPAIASRIGGIPEILTDEFEKFIFVPNDKEDMVRVLKSVLDWMQTDPSLGKRCREHVRRNFALNQTVQQIESILIDEANIRLKQ